MELAFLVYLTDFLPNLEKLFGLFSVLFFFASFAITFWLVLESKLKNNKHILYLFWSASFVFCFLEALIPDKKTMYIMAGAYATQQVYESEEAKRIGNKVVTLLDKKLQQYIDEIDLGDTAKKVVEEVNK